MKIKRNKLINITIVIIFIVVYILFAVKPFRSNIQLEPVWTIDVINAERMIVEDTAMPFKLGNNIGYFTENGEVCLLKQIEDTQMSAITEDVYAVYNNTATETEVNFIKEDSSSVIRRAGFPFFEEGRLFMMYPNGNGFSKYAKDGSELWGFEYYCPITSIQSTENLVVVGFADGVIIVLDSKGEQKHVIQPAGSEYEVIFGTAISKNGEYIACISGLNKQRLVLIDISEKTSKIVFHEYVDIESIDQRLVRFSENGKYVFFNEENSFVAVDIDERESVKIPTEGKVVQIKEAAGGDFYFVLSKDSDESTVHILNKNMYYVGNFKLNNRNTFIESDSDNLYVGNGQKISKISLKAL